MTPDTAFPRNASSMHVWFTTTIVPNGGAYQTEMNTILGQQLGGANILCDVQTRGLTPAELARMTWTAYLPLEALPLTKDSTRTLTTVQTNQNGTIANTTASIVSIDF